MHEHIVQAVLINVSSIEAEVDESKRLEAAGRASKRHQLRLYAYQASLVIRSAHEESVGVS